MSEPRNPTPDRLADWLAGHLDAEAERAFLATARQDPALAGEIEAHERLRSELRALPIEVPPARDLWPAIAAEVDRGRRARRFFRPVRLAAAAAALVLAGLVGWLVGRAQRPLSLPESTATLPVSTMTPSVMRRAAALPTLAAVDRSLDATRRELRQSVAVELGRLPPATRAVVDANLATIERAIADLERALAVHPGDADLVRAYVAYRYREIGLLRQVNEAAARL